MADRNVYCRLCRRRITAKIYRLRAATPLWSVVVQTSPARGPFEDNSPICKTCYDFHRRNNHQQPVQHNNENGERVNRVSASENSCCICGAPGRNRISPVIRAQCWQHERIYIPEDNRTCAHHINHFNGLLNDESLMDISNMATEHYISYQELAEYLGSCLNATFTPTPPQQDIKYNINVLQSESDCQCYTGLSLADFHDFCSRIHIPSMSQETKVKALALLLCKLRMGNSQDQLAHFFGLSQSVVSRYIEIASEAVDNQFVPHFLGFGHINREDYVANHMNTMTRLLHNVAPGAASAMLDGTYFEVEKSRNFAVQKVTYSLQKHYNLVKFMFVVAPDGYILHVYGPTGSDVAHNDASILNKMLPDADGLRSFFHEGDLFIVDRGFRDSQAACEDLGIRVRMPALLNGRKQLTREEADESRLVTKVRWVIESVNGRVKNVFAFFRNQIPNKYINKIGRFVRIACALLNAYFRPIYPDNPVQLEIANYIVDRTKLYSDFHEQILAFGLDVFNNQWRLSNISDIQNFPLLSEQDLRDITVGIYQIHNANSYTALHLERFDSSPEDLENYRIYTHSYFDGVILGRIPSRHVQTRIYNSIIAFTPGNHGPNAIVGYFCSCYIGLRVVGMCSHVASILWLLSFAVQNDAYRIPARDIANDLINLRLM